MNNRDNPRVAFAFGRSISGTRAGRSESASRVFAVETGTGAASTIAIERGGTFEHGNISFRDGADLWGFGA